MKFMSALGNCRRDCQRDHCNLPYTSAKKMLMRYFHSFDFKKLRKNKLLKAKVFNCLSSLQSTM